MEEGIVINS